MRSFMKINPSRNGKITLPLTDVGKSAQVESFSMANMSFKAIRENKICTKCFEFTVRTWVNVQNFQKLDLRKF